MVKRVRFRGENNIRIQLHLPELQTDPMLLMTEGFMVPMPR